MRTVDIIARKRDGHALSREEIAFIIRGYTAGDVADYQMAALTMAIYLRGMTNEETIALTEAMLRSGEVLDLSDLGRPRVDKHSTGGVGDKTSLVIAPVVAAAGVLVPMISGRALAHSGGTLDKLESIPGFRTDLSLVEFRATLKKVGAALIGQTAEIAPADKKLYALRDVTGTVESPFLICASIMSKKLAEGIDALVLDVARRCGVAPHERDRAFRWRPRGIELVAELEPPDDGGDQLHAGGMELGAVRGAHAEIGPVTEDLAVQELVAGRAGGEHQRERKGSSPGATGLG